MKRFWSVKIETSKRLFVKSGMACAIFLVGSALILSVDPVLAKDIEDIEADIAEDLEEEIAAKLEEDIEEETSGKAEEDIAEDLAEDIADDLEEQMKLEQRLQRDLEDDLEEALKVEQRLERDLADDLEDAEKERLEELEDLAEAAEDAAKEDEREAERLEKQRRDRRKELAGIDTFLDEDEEPAIPGEILFLVEAKEVQRFEELGVDVAQSRDLEGLGLVLLTVRGTDDRLMENGMPIIPDELDDTLSDYNHLYTLDSEPDEMEEIAIDLASHMPVSLAGKLRLNTPTLTRSSIGLIDTSVDASHLCLKGARIEQASFVPDDVTETDQHGTSVASILLADARCGIGGLVGGAQLYSASVFFRTVRGSETATVDGLVRAIDWLIKNEVRVINLSLSGPPNALLHRAVQEAVERGIFVVAAVGNAGPAAPPRYPAAYPEAIGITAADGNNIVYRRAGRGDHVAFTAPGVDIAVAVPGGFALRSGTSIATPFASALLLEASSGSSDPELLQRFQSSTRDLGAPGFDDVYGHGLVRMPAVLQVHIERHADD